MKQKNITGFLASLAAGVAGVWLAPFSPMFVLAAVAWGVVYVILRFAFWTPKSDWLPFLVAMLVVMAGRVVTRSWIVPGIREGSAAEWSLDLLFIGIVGVVVFGYRLLFLITKARGSL